MQLLSGIVVFAFAFFLFGLAILIFVKPLPAERFLSFFASSTRAHSTEQGLRLLVGVALILFSPQMWLPTVFLVFGWVIVATAIGLMLVPWQWHHRFGKWAIPLALRHKKLLAVGAFALAATILCCASRLAFA